MRLVPLVLALATAAPAFAQPAPAAVPERGAVFAGVSYLRSKGFLGFENGTDTRVLTLRLGGEARLFSRPGPSGPATGTLGVALQAADFNGDGALESGLRPQSVEVYGRLAPRPGLAATAGFVLDVGPGFGLGPEDASFPNSDLRDAVRLGAETSSERGRSRLTAGAEGLYLLPVTELLVRTDPEGLPAGTFEYSTRGGHYLTVHAGAARRLSGAVEAGLRIVGVARGRETAESDSGCDIGGGGPGADDRICFVGERRYVASLVPHVRYARPGSPLAVTLAAEATAGYFGEHTRLGIGGVGDGTPRARVPLTLAVRYTR